MLTTVSEVPHRLSDDAVKDFAASMVSPDCRCAEALIDTLMSSINSLENELLNATAGYHEAYFHKFYDDLEVLLTICMTISIRASGFIVIESLLFVWSPDDPPPANQQLTLKERKNKNSLSVKLHKVDYVCCYGRELINTADINISSGELITHIEDAYLKIPIADRFESSFLHQADDAEILVVLTTFRDVCADKPVDNAVTTSECKVQRTVAGSFDMVRLLLTRIKHQVVCSKVGVLIAWEPTITVSGFTGGINDFMFPESVAVKELESSGGFELAWNKSLPFKNALWDYSSVHCSNTTGAHFGSHTDDELRKSGVKYPTLSRMKEKDLPFGTSIDSAFTNDFMFPEPVLIKGHESPDDFEFPSGDALLFKDSLWNYSSAISDSTPGFYFGLHADNKLKESDIKDSFPLWMAESVSNKYAIGTGCVSSYGSCC